jgi:hypothetical protein
MSKKRIISKSWTVAAAMCLLAGGLAAARAEDDDHSKMDRGAMGREGMNHGGMDRGASGQGGMMGGMDHGGKGGGMSGMMSGMMGGMRHGGSGGGHHGMMKNMMCRMTEHVDGRLAYLKAELKLNDAQQNAWNLFADNYRAAAARTAQQCEKMDDKTGDHAAHKGVLGHLGMMESHMTAHLDSVKAIKGAIEPLFNVLSEEQKKTANEVMTGMMGLGMGGMGGGGMMGGMMGGDMSHGGSGGDKQH